MGRPQATKIREEIVGSPPAIIGVRQVPAAPALDPDTDERKRDQHHFRHQLEYALVRRAIEGDADEPGGRDAASSALAQRSGVSKQAMSKLLHELETRGYVEQVADPNDTRAKIVRLTRRGAALRVACLEARGELQALAAETLGKVKLARLQRKLTQLTAALSRPYDR